MGTAWFMSVSVVFLLFIGQCHGVTDIPTIAGLPSIYKVKEESRLRIDCSAYTAPGNPSTTRYKWTYSGSTVSTGPIVDRSSIRRSQGGQYTCTASNTEGSASSSVTVDIQYAPTIAALPSIFKVSETSHLKIDCSTYTTLGNPSTTSYGWTYGGSTVSTGAVLDRSSIRKSQAGLYTCTASNTLTPSGTSQQQGRTSAQVNVDVQYRPTIAGLPSIYKVKEESRLRIDCSAYTAPGNPSTTRYKWTNGGSTVSTRPIVDRSSIRRSQGGQYTCTASNTEGSASSSVTVDIQYGPTIVGLPLIRKVKERTRLRIDCSTYTTLGNPSTTSYGWTYGGSTVSTWAILRTRSIRRSQAGLYTCTASNTLTPSGTSQQQGRTSAQVNVDVQYIDTPRLTFEEYEVQENDTVTLSCNVSSNPIVIMTVRRPTRGTVLVAKRVNSLSHTIQRARCLDTGTYTCSATNTAGYHIATKKLNVLCPPRHDYRKQLDSVVISNRQRAASLVADIIANPRPSFTWHRYDGQVMSSVSGGAGAVTSTGLQSALQINITSDVDYGDYTVDVENSEGRARLTYTLSAASPPSAPSQVQASAVGDTSVSLQWVSGYNGGANQTFTMLYKSDLHYHWAIWRDDITDPGRGTQVKEAILLLTPTLAYQFHLYGVNVYGEGEGVTINTTTLSSGKYELAVGLGTSNGAFMVITILVIGYFVRRRTSGKGEITNTHADGACDNMYTDPVVQMHCQVTELECVYEPVETERMQSAEAAEEELYCNTAEPFKGEKTKTHSDKVCNSGYTDRATHHQVSELERVYVQFEMGRMQSAEDAEEEVYCNTAELNNESLYMNTL
ncbi:hemicentin-2-like [Haliotis rufescens]|uniref:hemicentin-2-like n=1 Tax=Haliotis rufescens TaxID=6454 RepID=UPI00201F9184|nr:hemicentin-2-like [Haliotis rufescens]